MTVFEWNKAILKAQQMAKDLAEHGVACRATTYGCNPNVGICFQVLDADSSVYTETFTGTFSDFKQLCEGIDRAVDRIRKEQKVAGASCKVRITFLTGDSTQTLDCMVTAPKLTAREEIREAIYREHAMLDSRDHSLGDDIYGICGRTPETLMNHISETYGWKVSFTYPELEAVLK